jgi:hypothetical protein
MAEAQNEMAASPEQVAALEMARRTAAFKGGANWFYWIAGLSIVNSVISLLQGGLGFIFGLGITQFVDAVGAAIVEERGDGAGLIRIIALGVSVFFAGFFVLFGWLANQGMGWAFLIGMVLYALDGLLYLLVQDWLSLGFHGFALYCMFNGYTALRRLRILVPPAVNPQIGSGPQA